MATIAGLRSVNLALVGFHAGSPTLSDVKKYPTFLRVNPIITGVIDAIINLLQRTFCAFQPTYCRLSVLVYLSVEYSLVTRVV